MTTTTERIYNFSAGPSILPVPVLERVREEMLSLPGVGMSVLEISHRSTHFDRIFDHAVGGLRELLGLGEEHKILLLQGGASLQFSMVPMNLLGPGQTADYVDTGSWAKKAMAEARRLGSMHVAATTRDGGYRRIPRADDFDLTPGSAYTHITSNNTIEGTEWHWIPDVGPGPLVVDASSDILSRPMEYGKFALVYAGAQKNLGPSGVTLVAIREDLVARRNEGLPPMLDYRVQVEGDSRYNTPNTFGIYALGLTLDWIRGQGGLPALAEINRRKAEKLYAELDRTAFWNPVAEAGSRSLMNVTFTLSSPELEKRFVDEATTAGLDGLKGHRSVGGMRASIYNAFPEAGVDALVEFMKEFERRNG